MPSANDSYAARATITGATGSSSVDLTGNTIEASEKYTVNDPVVDTRVATATAWWSWTAPATGDVEFVFAGSVASQVHMLVVSAPTGPTTLGTGFFSRSGRGRAEARLQFRATSGVVYGIQGGQLLDGPTASTVTLSWAQPPSATRPLANAGSYKGRDTAALDDAQVA